MTCEGVGGVLGDYVELQRGTTYKSALLDQPGPVLLGLSSIARNGGFRADNLRTYGGESQDKLLVRSGQLYASLKDVTQSADLLGAVAKVPDTILCGRLTQDTVRLDIIDTAMPSDYLYWLLRTPQYRAYCRAHATGTTNLGLSREDFLAYEVPPLTMERRAIVHALQALDDKIENNRRLAKTLEEIAAAVFKSWFVDFAGHSNLVGSEIGPIPDGWAVKPVGETLRIVGGSTPSTKEPAYWDEGIHCWATPKDLSGRNEPILLDTVRHITNAGMERISSGLLPPRTVLMSSRAPVGYTAISLVPLAVNQGFIAVPPSPMVPSEYVLFWMRSNMDLIKANAGGTTFAEISKRAFRPLPMLVPPEQELKRFQDVSEPVIDRIVACVRDIDLLTEIRDALLPKLICGAPRADAVALESTGA